MIQARVKTILFLKYIVKTGAVMEKKKTLATFLGRIRDRPGNEGKKSPHRPVYTAFQDRERDVAVFKDHPVERLDIEPFF